MKRNSLKEIKILCVIITMAGLSVFFPSCPQPGGENTWTGETPPAAPAAPAVRPGNQKLILSWSAVPGANSYEVFYEKTEPGARASPKQTVYVSAATISNLENGETYYVWLRAKNSAGTSRFSPSATGIPAVQSPSPSVIRGNGQLSVGWAAEDGVDYEVWYGTSDEVTAASEWNNTINLSGNTAGTTITGLDNGTVYHVWIKTEDSFREKTTGTPETPPASIPEGFVYVSGGTVTGSSDYAFTVTVPNDPAYNNPGSSSVQKGVFVAGRRVNIDSFVMAQYETTQELWYTVQTWALEHGYQFQNKKNNAPSDANKNKPVTGISWRDAVVWCNAYSEMMELEPVYYYPAVAPGNILRDSRNAAVCDNAEMDKTKSGYRLPTEAEREFAARGGDPGLAGWMYVYAGSNTADNVAWHRGNSGGAIQIKGTKAANRLNIRDLSGNVQEWCWDWMHWTVAITEITPDDGAVYHAVSANQKAFNGGGVGSNPTLSCVAYRWGYAPDYKDNYVGFRVVRNP